MSFVFLAFAALSRRGDFFVPGSDPFGDLLGGLVDEPVTDFSKLLKTSQNFSNLFSNLFWNLFSNPFSNPFSHGVALEPRL